MEKARDERNVFGEIASVLQFFSVSKPESILPGIGEDLSEQLGRVLEAKLIVNRAKIRLEKGK